LTLRHLLPALLCLAVPLQAADVAWLYDVAVPVEDQSSSARLDAAGRGLTEVLSRITGLASVPRNEVVSRALAAPDLYYNQFRFDRKDDELLLSLQFVPQSVLGLIRDARLPIWGANRPTVLAWIVVEDDNERSLLGAASEHPLIDGLQDRARYRGLPLRLPLLDLADQLVVEPAAVWGRLSQTLLPASERYGADIVVVGRIQHLDDDRWVAAWEFWIDAEVREHSQQSAEPAALGRGVADLLADELASRYAVLDRGVRRLELQVSAVNGAADYAEMLRYFNALEFVEQVQISSVASNRLGVSLMTGADPDQLMDLFRLDQRLFPDLLHQTPGPPIELVWQRR
jgi:uncharacterized protein